MIRRPFDRVRWVFFDLGSTLIDDTHARRLLLTQIAQRLRQEGVVAQPSELERSLRSAFMRFSPDPWEQVLTELVRDAAMSRRIIDELPYPKHLELPYLATLPLVTALAGSGTQLGVIANQSLGTEERLITYGLRRYFSCCLTSAEVGIAKPDDRIFRLAQEMAQCSGDELMMVGDRLDNDIRPARQLGWATIRVRKGLAQGQRPRDSLDLPDRSCRELLSVAKIMGVPTLMNGGKHQPLVSPRL